MIEGEGWSSSYMYVEEILTIFCVLGQPAEEPMLLMKLYISK